MKNVKQNFFSNKHFQILTGIYMIILFFFGIIACSFSYRQKEEELLYNLDMTLMQLEQEYVDVLDNFWQIYMPIFEYQANSIIYHSLDSYYNNHTDENLPPLEKLDLTRSVANMALRNSQIQWIALYSPNRNVNYIYYTTGNTLQPLPDDFPYLEELQSETSGMREYGIKPFSYNNNDIITYSLCGGIPERMGDGKIMAGFSVSSMQNIAKQNNTHLEGLKFIILSDQQILFDSTYTYDMKTQYLPDQPMHGIYHIPDNGKLYVKANNSGNSDSLVCYTVPYNEISRYAHSFTLPIMLMVLVFAVLGSMLSVIMLKLISKEVSIIQRGLERIGDNHLEYQIPTDFRQCGLPEIASSINLMAKRLHENINRAYYYKIKQTEAELAELQAKFNPHFLYNTLEMLRFRCLQNNDEATANLITQLAAIFRGFISSKTFIPITEELAFSKRYLTLFSARYGEQVQVRFNISTEIIKYGIVRNIFQPLIENYFVHGFDSAVQNNYILFTGEPIDDTKILISVEDNGSGMSEEEVISLNEKLNQKVELSSESYGLKNLHQRLQLFYGEDYGIKLIQNEDKGITIHMMIQRLTCEEYENRKTDAIVDF